MRRGLVNFVLCLGLAGATGCSLLSLEGVRVPTFMLDYMPQQQITIDIKGADKADLYVEGRYIAQAPTTMNLYAALPGFSQQVAAYSPDGCWFANTKLRWSEPVAGFAGRLYAPPSYVTIEMQPFDDCREKIRRKKTAKRRRK